MINDNDLEKVMHFSRAFHHCLTGMDSAAAGDDLSGPEAHCLLYLAFHGKSTLVGLNQHYGTDLAFLSRLVKSLEGKGYVYKEPHPNDRRSVYLMLTEKGLGQIPVLKDRIRRYFQSVFGDLSESQVSELIGHIQAIDAMLQSGGKDHE